MMRLHYTSIGQGPAVLIVHGLLGSSDNWRNLARQLSDNYQVITVDCRNHGRSFHHPQQNYALMAEDLLPVLDELQLDKISLIGHSMGGKVVMQFAHTWPERLDKLIVVDMAARQYRDSHSYLLKLLMAVDLNHCTTLKQVDAALAHEIKSPAVRSFLLLNLQKTETGLRWRANLEHLLCNYQNLIQPVKPESAVQHVGVFIRGADSNYVTDADFAELATLFPNMQQQTLEAAGHWLHADQPELFLQHVRAVLKHD